MPTPTKGPRLGGGPAHERLMLANLATSLFEHRRITTTETRAKRLRPLAERLITFAKRGDLHARRRVLTVVRDKNVVHELFTEIAPMNGTTYAVEVSGMTSNGTITATIDSGVAADPAGNPNTASTSIDNSVLYDNTEPVTSLTGTPTDPSNSLSPVFSFEGSDTGGAGLARFECSLDGDSFSPCTSPQMVTIFGDTNHTFRVRAVDAALNVDTTPASFTWRLDSTAPDTTITGVFSRPLVQRIKPRARSPEATTASSWTTGRLACGPWTLPPFNGTGTW